MSETFVRLLGARMAEWIDLILTRELYCIPQKLMILIL